MKDVESWTDWRTSIVHSDSLQARTFDEKYLNSTIAYNVYSKNNMALS